MEKAEHFFPSSLSYFFFFSGSTSNSQVLGSHSIFAMDWQISRRQSFLLNFFTPLFCIGKPLLSKVSSKKASLMFVCHCHGLLLFRCVSFLGSVSCTYPWPYHSSKVFYGLLNDDLVANICVVLFIEVVRNPRSPAL